MEAGLSKAARFGAACASLFARVGAWVAAFSFWQFVLISVLALAAAGIIDSVVVRPEGKPHRLVVDHDDEELTINKDGIAIRRKKAEAPPASAAEESDKAPRNKVVYAGSDRTSLPEWVLVLLAILWVMRVATRSRAKAEARATQAESRAQYEGLERQLAEARLQALQAQVEPHFLFNTLAAVEHLIETDPARAAVMQRHLIAFLRGALPRMRAGATRLGDEIELCRSYLAIMKIRMEDRLDYSIEVPAELLEHPFPPLMLQSLVENAIKHGLEPKAEGGSLFISARHAAGRLRVTVADSGLGFGNSPTTGSGIGLTNIRERLGGQFGQAGALTVSPNVPTGSQVSIELPYETTDGDHRR